MEPQAAPTAAPVAAPTIPPEAGGPSAGSSKKIYAVAGILVALIIVAGGLIYLRNQQQIGVAPLPAATVNAFEDLQKEADSADVGSDTDMNEVDTDLNSL